MLEFLSQKYLKPVLRLGAENVEEIRLRVSCPALVKTNGEYMYLTPFGASPLREESVVFTEKDSDELFSSITEKSVYAYREQVASGFITRNGVRTGVSGKCVTLNGKVENITNFTSFNVRIPHRIEGSADELFALFSKRRENILVLSPPGAGKTTIVRDLAEQISSSLRLNVLIADERGEIFPLVKEKEFIDCISFCPKEYAFENGIRSMTPDVIVTDEIFGERDFYALENAVRSGVTVIATAHASSAEEYFSFDENKKIKGLFSLYAIVGFSGGKRKITVERKNLCGK